MPTRTAMLTAIVCLCAIGAEAHAVCVNGPVVQWTPEDGGNGHFYQVHCGPMSFTAANAAAVAVGRHLVTLDSSEENDFVFSLIDDPLYWQVAGIHTLGPWIGTVQQADAAEPADGWSWVTGETFGFEAWFSTEPNNSGGSEDNAIFYDGTGGGTRSAQWGDVDVFFNTSYVTEWEHSLDIDLDGEVEAIHDGVLILRSLFGLTGTALTDGAVDTIECNRCDAAAIQPFLDRAFAGSVHDVAADWSDSANPNGPWSYLEGTDPLPHVASWQSSIGGYSSSQPAWAASENGNNRIPLFLKSIGAEQFTVDYIAGDVVGVPRDDVNGVGMGEARLRFVTPATGNYRVALAAWIGREIGRSASWTLFVGGVQQASGTVASGDVFSRATPDGYEGSFALAAGEEVDLLLASLSANGEFVGFDLRLEAFGLDVDGDGETRPLSDGLLILRYLFGFTDTTLTAGAVDLGNCTRCDATAILAFLDALD